MALMPFEPCEGPHSEFHAVMSVSMGELAHDGILNWTDDPEKGPVLDWSAYAYSPEQYKRVCDMFLRKYWGREASIWPLKQWALTVQQAFIEASFKYNPMYKALEDGYNPLQDFDNYEKQRDVYSDFPATQLATKNQDYASNATDRERETVQIGDVADKVDKYARIFRPIDSMLLDDVAKVAFSKLYTVSMDGF